MSAEQFVTDFVAKLRAKGADLQAWGAAEPAATCERIASDLESDFRSWWLAELTVPEAATASGLSEDWLRSLVRGRKLPAQKGAGVKGHLTIRRCDLPHRPTHEPQPISSIGERLLRKSARSSSS